MNKILFVSHNLEFEGATWSLFYLALGFRKRGWEVSVLSLQHGPLLEAYKKEGIPVEVRDFTNKQFTVKDEYQVFFVNTILGFHFIEKLNENQIHRTVWCIRESEREVYFKKYVSLEKRYFSMVKNVVFVSDVTRKIYEDLDNEKKFVTIHNGLDLEKINSFRKHLKKNALRKKYGFIADEYIVSIIGTVCLRKGQLEFTEAAINALRKKKDIKVKFLIIGAGRGGSYERRIREMIDASGYNKDIFLINETPRAFDYYCMSDLFVCNSYIESFPRVVLEAMAFELPIIATNVYGIPEQIENNKEGVLIMAGDVLALEEKMLWAMENRGDAVLMAKNARKKIEINFTFETMINKYIALIEKICAE